MRKNLLLPAIAIGLLALAACPLELSAKEITDFGGRDISSMAEKAGGFLFGPLMKVAGTFGGAYGVYKTILSSDITPLVRFGGIGLSIGFLPSFINSVYSVSGMLLP